MIVLRSKELFLLILTACLLCTDASSGLSFHAFTAPIVTALFISVPTALLPNIIRQIVQWIIAVIVVAICLADCYCLEFLHVSITPQILSSVFLSDSREMMEFLSDFVNWSVVFNWRIVALLLTIVVFFVLYIPTISHRLTKTLSKPIKLSFFSLFLICIAFEMSSMWRFAQLFLQGGDTQRIEGLIFRHYHEEVSTPLHRFVFANYALHLTTQTLETVYNSTMSANIDSCSHISPHIVFVIGESYNKHHSSLYGYSLQTTPNQRRRKDAGELFLFNNVVSPWNITSNVFLDIFSLWEHDMTDSESQYPLFPILFRKAGYEVRFFTNQYSLLGFNRGTTNQGGHFFLSDWCLSNALFSFRNPRSHQYDMHLIDEYKAVKHQAHPPYTLDIVHLIGQHFEYRERYPKNVSRFSMSDYVARKLSKEAREIVMHYDNATHYNDEVIDSLLTEMEHEESIVIFVSDHGEEVYDDIPTHGRLFNSPTAIQAQNEYEVPMWIWCSERYRKGHPDVVNQIREATAKPFMTDGIPQILLSLAGISCPWTNEKHNPLSHNYKCKRRIIAESTDYDELTKR